MSTLEIQVKTLENATQQFVQAWHEAEISDFNSINSAKEVLTFANLEILLKVLTPKRLDLLRTLHEIGTTSIRALSQNLGRDYSNVHSDVALLLQSGLIKKIAEDQILVPWQDVIAHFSLVNSEVIYDHLPHSPISASPHKKISAG